MYDIMKSVWVISLACLLLPKNVSSIGLFEHRLKGGGRNVYIVIIYYIGRFPMWARVMKLKQDTHTISQNTDKKRVMQE